MALQIEKNYEDIRRHMDSNSIVRQIMSIDVISVGDIAQYSLKDTDYTLDDIYTLIRRADSFEILNGKDAGVPDKYNMAGGEEFYGVTFDFAIINDTTDNLEEQEMSSTSVCEIKKDFLDKEENIFIDFLREVAKSTEQYLLFEKEEDAIEFAKNIDYEKIWVGEVFKNIEFPHMSGTFSPNLRGFIFVHAQEALDAGIFTIRQEITSLPDCRGSQWVTYEDVAMTLMGKNLTFIEVGK